MTDRERNIFLNAERVDRGELPIQNSKKNFISIWYHKGKVEMMKVKCILFTELHCTLQILLMAQNSVWMCKE